MANGRQLAPPSRENAPAEVEPDGQPVRTTYEGFSVASARPVAVPDTGFDAIPRDGEAVRESWYITPMSPSPLSSRAPEGGAISCRTADSSSPRISGAQRTRSRVP